MSLTFSKKILAAVLSVATIGTALTATTQQASAFPHGGGFHHHGGGFHHGGWGHRGWGYGLGALALGAVAYGAYDRPCRLVRQFDDEGNYVGRVRVCRPYYE